MCHHNYTQHSGCGHYGPVYTNLYTPCETAFQQLLSTRGPSSPALSPPPEFFPPSRSNTTTSKRSSKRFFSIGGVLQRSSSTASNSSRRVVSGPEARTGTSATSIGNNLGVADHELAHAATKCPNLKPRTIVSSNAGQVCKECSKWIEAMRNMVAGYDKGRGIKGTPAFKEFLERREECVNVAVELGFAVPTRGPPRGIMGAFGGGTRTPPDGWTVSETDSLYD